MDKETKFRGAGGTPGGLGAFLVGLAMILIGGYLFTDRVTVTSGYWQLWGHHTFGYSLIPLCLGVGWLFFDGRSIGGWVVTVGSLLLIAVGIIANLQVYFSPTSLTGTLIMLGLIAGGMGLVARSLKSY
ncbi:MAG TPA: hypothetical protein VJ302_15875 [Blastocatellia bacterium]|nr:hypothetical protein [Blastocatellia bacterium]